MNNTVVRFALVGLINTLVDVVLFVALRTVGHFPLIIANICSTSTALIISFILNYRFTFRSRSLTNRKKLLYFGVTLFGLWILQPVVINLILHINNNIHFTSVLVGRLHSSIAINNLVAKLGATAVTLIWNYVWYSRIIFKSSSASLKA